MKSFEDLRTVRWNEGRIILIDQTELPHRLSFVECISVDEVASANKKLMVRGAPAIGVAAAMGLALTAQKSRSSVREELLEELSSSAKLLTGTRPTAANLSWALQRILTVAGGAGPTVELVKRAVISEAIRMADEDVEANRRMGEFGATLIADGDVVMTHCNRPLEAGVGRVRGPSPLSATALPSECSEQLDELGSM